MIDNIELTLNINGENRKFFIKSNELLSDVLRYKVGIKSLKEGCGRGDCGTCTVLLNGKSVRSCLILAIEVDNQEITTLEGIGKNGITILQQSFIENNAFQCGFCAPGIIISATELLKSNINPTTKEIKESLAGNLCRCTGYESIIKSIKIASQKIREEIGGE